MNFLGLDSFEKDQWGSWNTKYQVEGIPFATELYLYLDEDENEPDTVIEESFKMLEDKREEFVAELLASIIKSYEDDLPNSRAIAPEYGNNPDEVAPILEDNNDIWQLIRDMSINLMSNKYSGFNEPIFEIVFGCTWEPEKRFSVYYANGSLDELY